MPESFEAILSGGHHNSLGRTEEVVEIVLSDQSRLQELLDCYGSSDELVRLRTSSAVKRVTAAQPEWVVPYIDFLLTTVADLDQASAQWTLARLLLMLEDRLTAQQRELARTDLLHNLSTHQDWIVLIETMKTLSAWAQQGAGLRQQLLPLLEKHAQDPRKSVSKAAQKIHADMSH